MCDQDTRGSIRGNQGPLLIQLCGDGIRLCGDGIRGPERRERGGRLRPELYSRGTPPPLPVSPLRAPPQAGASQNLGYVFLVQVAVLRGGLCVYCYRPATVMS